jgi:hypothetical protein
VNAWWGLLSLSPALDRMDAVQTLETTAAEALVACLKHLVRDVITFAEHVNLLERVTFIEMGLRRLAKGSE